MRKANVSVRGKNTYKHIYAGRYASLVCTRVGVRLKAGRSVIPVRGAASASRSATPSPSEEREREKVGKVGSLSNPVRGAASATRIVMTSNLSEYRGRKTYRSGARRSQRYPDRYVFHPYRNIGVRWNTNPVRGAASATRIVIPSTPGRTLGRRHEGVPIRRAAQPALSGL